MEPLTDCFIYLVHHGPGAEIDLLFPPSLGDPFEKNELEMTLDQNVGEETFHLLASNERLIALETLLKDHASADAGAKTDFSGQIVDEIRNLRRNALAAHDEKPVSIASGFRGVRGCEFTQAAVEFSGERFFAKSFTIDHR